jgi:hypothetical protein
MLPFFLWPHNQELELTEADRRSVGEALLEIPNQDPDIALCNQAAAEAAMMLDRMEETVQAAGRGRSPSGPLPTWP